MNYTVDVTGIGDPGASARFDVVVEGARARLGRNSAGEAGGDPADDAADDRAATLDTGTGGPMRVLRVGSETHEVHVQRLPGRGHYILSVGGFRYEVEALDARSRAIRDLTAAAAGPAGPAPLLAPMPGLIVRVNVHAGDLVQAGQPLVVMEAMKMENELRTPAAGTVKAVLVAPGVAVEKGARLVELE